MKLSLIICMFFIQLFFAQDWKSSSTNLSGKEFPRINAKNEVEFKIYFPDAKSVVLDGGDGMKNVKSVSEKDNNGFWTITTSPVEIGFHYYWLNVDGKRTNDPNTQLYFGYGQPTSGIEIPSGEDFFLRKNIRHGKILNDSLYSNITKNVRNFKVYLPPNYEKGKFPVLYLYHGTGEDITGWERQGYIENILDNLFAAKKAREMIVIMDYGVALTPELERMPDNYPRTVLSSKNLDKWLVSELMPYIEKHYKTNGNNAVAGLSRGSYQAMLIGVNHPEKFSAIGAFSPVIYEGTQAEPYKELPIQNLLKSTEKTIFFIGIGEKEGNLFEEFNNTLTAFLKSNDYPFVEYRSPGTYHEWLTWRRCLYQFAQKIFKK